MSANLDSQLSSFIDSGVIQGRFPAQKFLKKIPVWNFSNFTRPMELFISPAQTRPKLPHVRLLFLYAGDKRSILGTTILSNGKRHFGQIDRNDQTGQSGPPSKLVQNIAVRQNRSCRNFGLNEKRPKRDEMVTITMRFLRFVILLSQRYKETA